MTKRHQLRITNPELDLHQSGVVVFRGSGPAGAAMRFSLAGREAARRTIGRDGSWEVKLRVPAGQRRVEVAVTAPDGSDEVVRRSVRFLDAAQVASMVARGDRTERTDPAHPPILTHARLGIGVTDPEWWRLRYETLRSIMLPSLVQAHVLGHRLLLAVDSSISQAVLDELKLAVLESGASGFADIVFTDSVWTYPQTVENYLRLHFGDVPVIMHGIDDDDAVAHDFFDVARAKIAAEDPAAVQLHTFPFGLAYNIELHRVQLAVFPWHSMNQVAFGRPALIHTLRSYSHNRIQVEGAKRGWTVRVHDDARLGFLYTHHKQSDSGYVKRLETMRLNDQAMPLDEHVASHFGVELASLGELSGRMAELPAVTGRTWLTSTQFQDAERNLLKASESIKQLRLAATASIVERSTAPTPAPDLEVELGVKGDAGLVRFHGTYLGGHFVRIRVDGKDLASLFVGDDGAWAYPLRLAAGDHTVEVSGVSPHARPSDSASTRFVVGEAKAG